MTPPRVRPPVDGDERAQLVGWLDRLLAEYVAQCARSNEIVAAALDAVRRDEEYCPGVHLRWVLTDMVEETARHLGHLDAVRELIDGRTGYY